jgi:DNA modification methylase
MKAVVRSPKIQKDGGGKIKNNESFINALQVEERNKRSVWTVPTKGYSEAHFATFPPDLIEPCILAGCPAGGTVLDPFGGAGTTGLVSDRHGRNALLIELKPEYADMARKRIYNDAPLFAEVS